MPVNGAPPLQLQQRRRDVCRETDRDAWPCIEANVERGEALAAKCGALPPTAGARRGQREVKGAIRDRLQTASNVDEQGHAGHDGDMRSPGAHLSLRKAVFADYAGLTAGSTEAFELRHSGTIATSMLSAVTQSVGLASDDPEHQRRFAPPLPSPPRLDATNDRETQADRGSDRNGTGRIEAPELGPWTTTNDRNSDHAAGASR
jgi:hypothetical protein